MAYQGISLGDIYANAAQIKGAQQRQQLGDIALQNAKTDQSQTQGVNSLIASNPNASLSDLAKVGGMKGVAASGDLTAARTQDASFQALQQLHSLQQQKFLTDRVAADPSVMPQVADQLSQIGVQGHPDGWQHLPPQQIQANAKQASQALDAQIQAIQAQLVDPKTQFEAAQTAAQNRYKQQGAGGEAERNAATISGEDRRARFNQSQENARNAANIDAANTRAGFTKDGQLDPKFDSQVQAILDYRAAPFTGISMRSGPGASIMAEVNRRDPTYDASTYPAKASALKSLTSGKDGTTLDKVNTAVQHLSQLKGLLSALNTGDIGLINQAKQAYQKATGNAAPTNASVVANMAAGEVNKVVTGGPGAEGDRDLARASTQLTGSPEQQQGAMDNIIGLMAGRLNSVKNRFVQAKLGNQFDNMLLPETKAALAAHSQGSSPASAGGPSGAGLVTASGPGGKKLMLQNGAWVPYAGQ